MPENEVQIGFRGSRPYRAKIQREALDRGIKVQQLLEKAVDAYLTQPASISATPQPRPAPASQHQPWIDKLVTILEHGTDLDKVGIQSNLDAFCAKITLENLPRRKRAAGE